MILAENCCFWSMPGSFLYSAAPAASMSVRVSTTSTVMGMYSPVFIVLGINPNHVTSRGFLPVFRLIFIWCGFGCRSWFLFDADADPYRTFHPDVDPDPSFQKRLKHLKKCSNRLIFHAFWLVIWKFMWIRILFLFDFFQIRVPKMMRIRILIHNTDFCLVSFQG